MLSGRPAQAGLPPMLPPTKAAATEWEWERERHKSGTSFQSLQCSLICTSLFCPWASASQCWPAHFHFFPASCASSCFLPPFPDIPHPFNLDETGSVSTGLYQSVKRSWVRGYPYGDSSGRLRLSEGQGWKKGTRCMQWGNSSQRGFLACRAVYTVWHCIEFSPLEGHPRALSCFIYHRRIQDGTMGGNRPAYQPPEPTSGEHYRKRNYRNTKHTEL